MFLINNSRPDEILFNNNNIDKVLVNNGLSMTGIWGKSFNYSLISEHGSITIERTSSPYENAPLGILNLTQGDSIFYGDTLKISASNFQEFYEFNYFEINSQLYLTNPTTITCNSNLSLKLVTRYNYIPSWHVVFNGYLESNHQSTATTTTSSKYVYGLKANVPTKITGSLRKEQNTIIQNFSSAQLPVSGNYNGKTQSILAITQNNYIQFSLSRPAPITLYKSPFFVVTKIEQYY